MGQFGAVAGGGGLLPGGDVVELLDLIEAAEERGVAECVELVAAEIVGAALHVADLEVILQDGLKEGDVLEVELLLQVFGAGGDDDALSCAPAGEAQGRQEVGEGFAGAGAGFDDEMALVFER